MVDRDTVDYRDTSSFDDSSLQDVQTIKSAILHKQYGKDVRSALAQLPDSLIKLFGDTGGNNNAEVEEARGGFETLGLHEQAQNAGIDKVTVEVKNARTDSSSQTYPTLKERMDNQENYLNSNINSKLAQISAVPETFANLAALQSKYPTGKTGLFVTADNGHKFIWANGSWQDAGVYQSVGISNDTIVSKNVNYITPRDIRDTYANDKNISGWNRPSSFTSLNHTIMFTGSAGNSGILIPVDLPDGVTYADDLTINFSYMTSRVDSPAATFGWMIAKDDGSFFNGKTVKFVNTTQTTTMKKVTARFNLKSLTYADIPSHFNILIAIGGDYTVTIKDLYLNKNGVNIPFSEQIKSLDIENTTNGDNNIIPSAVNWGPIRKTVLSDGTLLLNNDYDGVTVTSLNQGIRFNTFWDGLNDLYVTVKMTGSPISKIGISLINMTTGAITSLKTNEFMVSQGVYENTNDNKIFVVKKSKLVSMGFNTSNTWILVSSSGNSWFHIKDITASSSMGFSKTRDTTNSILENTTVRQEASFGQSPKLLELSTTTTNSNYAGLELGTPSDAPLFTKDVYLKDVTIYSPIDTTVDLRVGSIDQNSLFVNNTWNIPGLSVKAGLNKIRYEKNKLVISAGQRMFIKLNNVGLYTPTADVPLFSKALIRDTTHVLNDGAYSGNQFYESDKIIPFSYTVVEKSLSDRANEVDAKIQSISESVDTIVPFMDNIFIKSASGKKFFLKVDENGNLTTKTTIPSHVVAFGNSLTYNWGNFGLAASNPNSDWFAHIKNYVTNVNPNATFNRFGLGQWENATTTADRNTVFTKDLAPQLTSDTDLVIIQLGDNINTPEKNATFKNDAGQLIKNIRLSSPNATIVWIGLWYQTFGNLIGDIKNATDTNNAIFVDISAIPRMSGTTSYLGAVQTDADGNTRVIDNTGRSSHPGDLGHQLIADAVTRKLQF
ncbi:SGNH/GDSL hydrolase family protein [Leuconostoc lactis]|uniref:SGNH/GDSL hydrolase family protein n=1 Tax=Leuconostoc lactis TaxID=1246 RepID=UPI0011BBDC59|nr:SGNH/GDSL hydrolase family protein [Leuconostoc lactis]QEA48079.1 SGNH/GDSL hydrolase family protein [Leuconostoc lactis]